MRVLNKFEQAATGDYPVSILGNSETEDFELVDTGAGVEIPIAALRVQIAKRGLVFFGMISTREGAPRIYLEEAPSAAMVQAISQAYCRHFAIKFDAAVEVLALRLLHAHPDARPN